MSTFHRPVLVQEVFEGLEVKEGKKYIDATVGGGGHGVEIIKRGGILLGIDLDQEALEFTKQKLEVRSKKLEIKRNWKLVQGNFRDLEKIAKENGFDKVSGILFDLGVSSHQLDTAKKGFSYRFSEAPLDLRFDQESGEPAAELINRLSEDELYEILAKFGEEPRARAIAEVLVRKRKMAPINQTSDLVTIIKDIVPGREINATLSRVFQALRIGVNDELSALSEGLKGAEKLLRSGGKLAVISFHSLEDRLVKQFMRSSGWRTLTKKPIVASQAEVARNSRARSAKLRLAEKI